MSDFFAILFGNVIFNFFERVKGPLPNYLGAYPGYYSKSFLVYYFFTIKAIISWQDLTRHFSLVLLASSESISPKTFLSQINEDTFDALTQV